MRKTLEDIIWYDYIQKLKVRLKGGKQIKKDENFYLLVNKIKEFFKQ